MTVQDSFVSFSESDKLILEKLNELGDTDYGMIIKKILPTLTQEWKRTSGKNYSDSKLKAMKKAVRDIWVDIAHKSVTYEIFNAFENFEQILFKTDRRYRGHFVHQFDVFLLGYYILNKILDMRDTAIKNKFSNGARERNEFEKPNFIWMLAATFHDMGYPIERIDYWFSDFLKDFLKIDTPYQIEVEKIFPPVFSEYITFLSKWHYNPGTIGPVMSDTTLLRSWWFHSTLETNLRIKNHGVISSLLLMHSLLSKEQITQSSQWLLETFPHEIMPACHAIALHNIEPFPRINLNEYPFAFLLVLCDTIQDWERSSNSQDYSELISLDVSTTNNLPVIECGLRIHNDKKIVELKKLENRLNTNGLISVQIKKEDGATICNLR